MDDIKINEQNKSIATGPFYVLFEFEAIWMLLTSTYLPNLKRLEYHLSRNPTQLIH